MTNENKSYNSEEIKEFIALVREGDSRADCTYIAPENRVYEAREALKCYRKLPEEIKDERTNQRISHLLYLLNNSKTIEEAIAFADRRLE